LYERVSVQQNDACVYGEIYPIIPSIEVETAYVIRAGNGEDSLIGVRIKYKDGDGDIGLEDGDTLPPFNAIILPDDPAKRNINFYYNNLHIDYLEKKDGEYKHVVAEFTGDTLRRQLRVMSLTPEGKFKAIRGTIDAQFAPSPYPDRADTIRLRLLLVDRALHVSNAVETPDIILNR